MTDDARTATGHPPTDGYTGHAEPGGPAIARTVTTAGGARVEVRKCAVGPMDNNAYLLTDVDAGEAVLVDAANEADRLLAEIGDRRVVAVVTTHGDRDHWAALADVVAATGATTWLHPADGGMVEPAVDEAAGDGTRIRFGAAEVELLHTPGHTPGSVCVLLRGDGPGDHLFSGDTLFPGGPGNTSRAFSDFPTVMRSLRERLFTLDDATWVYPGHGDDTTIGAERPSLDDWQARGW